MIDESNMWITTIDNPFDPFRQWEEWYAYDESNGHHTCSYLARIAITSNELSDEDQRIALHNAINEIVRLNINGLYRKVTSNSFKVEVAKDT